MFQFVRIPSWGLALILGQAAVQHFGALVEQRRMMYFRLGPLVVLWETKRFDSAPSKEDTTPTEEVI